VLGYCNIAKRGDMDSGLDLRLGHTVMINGQAVGWGIATNIVALQESHL
jgi:hypothetical protein